MFIDNLVIFNCKIIKIFLFLILQDNTLTGIDFFDLTAFRYCKIVTIF